MKLLLLTTGGTIAGNVARPQDEPAGVGDSVEDFKLLIDPTLAYIGLRMNPRVDITIESLEVADVDSSNITPEVWIELADHIYHSYDEYDAFVITHGTNTLGYTSAALSFALSNPGKPIVVTGSQVPSGVPGSDALLNLQNAIRVATWSDPLNGRTFNGVTVVFGSRILTGTRVKKDTEFAYDAFKSFGVSQLGSIAGRINIDESNLDKHLGYLSDKNYRRPAQKQAALNLENKFCMDIASLTEFPGMPTSLFMALVDHCNVKGFILRAFGAGDPSDRHADTFRQLAERQIPLIVTTQAPNGTSNFQVNEPGQEMRVTRRGIAAWDMSIESQTVKLAWLLAKKEDPASPVKYADIFDKMREDMHGEIGNAYELETAEFLARTQRR